MEELLENHEINAFVNSLHDADACLLCLDYDGTLAPFTIHRDKAFPYPGVVDSINELQIPTLQTVIISGRSIDDLIPLLDGIDPLPQIWGSHGWEICQVMGNMRYLRLMGR